MKISLRNPVFYHTTIYRKTIFPNLYTSEELVKYSYIEIFTINEKIN